MAVALEVLVACTRVIQKVRRPMQLSKRYSDHILPHVNIFFCNWNMLGLAFLLSSDFVVWLLSSGQKFAMQITRSIQQLC